MQGPQRQSPYPKSEDEVSGSRWELAHRLYGSGDPHGLFKGQPKTVAPWPSAGRTKTNPKGFDQGRVDAALSNPSAHMREMDPRNLHATQPWVTSEGTSYYMGDTYRKTGRTFRDMDQASNRFPVVYSNARGENRLLSGHHRATAALLRGEQFHVIHVEGD